MVNVVLVSNLIIVPWKCVPKSMLWKPINKTTHNVTLQVFTKHILEIMKKTVHDLQDVSGEEIADMIVEQSHVVTVKYRNGVLKDVIVH